jgi:hypothetical protein
MGMCVTTRRAALLAALGVPALAAAARGQDSAPVPPPPRPRPQPRRERVDNRPQPNDGAFMGGGMVVDSPRLDPRGDLAPTPNMRIEAPRQAAGPEPEVQFAPGLINPRLPGRGTTRQGQSDVNPLDYRLFNPAPGAHIRLPMTW